MRDAKGWIDGKGVKAKYIPIYISDGKPGFIDWEGIQAGTGDEAGVMADYELLRVNFGPIVAKASDVELKVTFAGSQYVGAFDPVELTGEAIEAPFKSQITIWGYPKDS